MSQTTTTKTTKTFTLGQVLSITTGRLTCEMEGVYEILNFITGDNLYTHALPRGARFARPFIAEEHPALVITPEQDADLTRRIDEAKSAGGNLMGAIVAWLSLLGLPMLVTIESHEYAWMSLDPMSELQGMIGDTSKIIAVNPHDDPATIAEKIIRKVKK